jgi:hypothetical protein
MWFRLLRADWIYRETQNAIASIWGVSCSIEGTTTFTTREWIWFKIENGLYVEWDYETQGRETD